MDYVSTRNKERKVSAAYAIANGIAPDGGLYCPTAFPALTDADWKTLAESDYKGRSALILGKFLTDFTAEELADFASKAYADEKFGGADTAPVVKLGEGKNLLELWHGPTCAFKDMALQMLPHLLTASLRKTGETRTACILVATSGDTGKAALDGFHDVPGTKIMVYYPVDGVSPMQKLQMVTQEGRNVEVVAIRGNFDDAQSAVKRIFTDEDTRAALDKDGMMLSSANSINWGRLAPQIAYYVSAYCDMVAAGTIAQGDKINVCVPTGNFGNILAAYIAKKMGLEEPNVAYHAPLDKEFTFYVVYGSCVHSVNYEDIHVITVESDVMSMEDTNDYIREHIGRKVVMVGASTGTDAIMNRKGFAGHYGLERYEMIEAYNLGSQVPNEDFIKKALELHADVLLVSQTVTQKDVHIQNLTNLIELLEAEGLRDKFVVCCGGPRITHELAKELGYDAGFGAGKYADDVASFAVTEMVKRGMK